MLIHRGSSTTTPNRTIYALSLAPSSAPWGASESAKGRPSNQHRASTRPAQASSAFPVRRDATASVAVGLPRSAGPERVKRWRRDQIHFSPERRACSAQPGMVGRERCGGRQRQAGRAATYTSVQPATSLGDPSTALADSERARPPRSSPDPASTAGTRSAAASS